MGARCIRTHNDRPGLENVEGRELEIDGPAQSLATLEELIQHVAGGLAAVVGRLGGHGGQLAWLCFARLGMGSRDGLRRRGERADLLSLFLRSISSVSLSVKRRVSLVACVSSGLIHSSTLFIAGWLPLDSAVRAAASLMLSTLGRLLDATPTCTQNSNSSGPTVSLSPFFNSHSPRTRSPLTSVPFLLPNSHRH